MELNRRFEDGYSHEDGLIFLPEECETLAVNCVRVSKGEQTEPAVHPDEEEIKEALAGNYCRCISHYQVLEAVKQAAREGSE